MIDRVRTRYRRVGLVLAVPLFVVGGLVALDNLDIRLRDRAWLILVAVALLGVPPMILLNAAEVRAAAALTGKDRFGWLSALETAVTGTAANLLPIPGATLVRVDALMASGAQGREALQANIAVGATWVAVSAAVSTVLLVGISAIAAATALLLALLSAVGATAILRKRADRVWVGRVLLIETAALAITAGRLWAIALALGTPVGAREATVIAASYAVTSAVGVFPGGLGLREVLSSGLAIIVGLPGSAGFATSAVDRLLGFAVHLPITLALAARHRR